MASKSKRGAKIYIKKYKRYFKISELTWGQARAKGITKKRWERAVKISKALKEYWKRKKEEEIEKIIEEEKKLLEEELKEVEEEEVKEEEEEKNYVAYVVWFSGKGYRTRREIRVYFKAKDGDEASEKGKELLRKAIWYFLDVSEDTIKKWHGYEVSVAETTEEYTEGWAEYLVGERLEDFTQL